MALDEDIRRDFPDLKLCEVCREEIGNPAYVTIRHPRMMPQYFHRKCIPKEDLDHFESNKKRPKDWSLTPV